MSGELVRQRSVGLLALLVLGATAWLLLFGLDQEPGLDQRSQLPAPPELERVVPRAPRLPEPVLPETEVPPRVAEGAQQGGQPLEPDAEGQPRPVEEVAPDVEARGEASSPEPPASAEPGLDERGLPRAWMVQVVSLRREDRAETLRDRLQDAGFKAWLQAGAGGTTRVLVGPRMQRSAAERDKAAIDRLWGLDTLVLRFEPPDEPE